MTALILIALLAGGGTSFAAQGAVPGDALYSIKVGVNEEFRSMLAVSNEAEARLQAALMEERLEEAEALAARGELTAEAAADIAVRMNAHASDANERSEQAEADGDYEAAASVRTSLQGTLTSYTQILSSLNVNGSNTGTANLLGDIDAIINTTNEAQATATVNTSVEADARAGVEATLDVAGDLLEKARAEFSDVQADLGAAVKANVEARLAEGATAYANAGASLKTNAYQAAYTSAMTAMRIAEEIRVMMASALRIDLNLDTKVDTILNNVINVETNTGGQGSADGEDVNTSDANTSVKSSTSVDSGVIQTDTRIETNAGIGL